MKPNMGINAKLWRTWIKWRTLSDGFPYFCDWNGNYQNFCWNWTKKSWKSTVWRERERSVDRKACAKLIHGGTCNQINIKQAMRKRIGWSVEEEQRCVHAIYYMLEEMEKKWIQLCGFEYQTHQQKGSILKNWRKRERERVVGWLVLVNMAMHQGTYVMIRCLNRKKGHMSELCCNISSPPLTGIVFFEFSFSSFFLRFLKRVY